MAILIANNFENEQLHCINGYLHKGSSTKTTQDNTSKPDV